MKPTQSAAVTGLFAGLVIGAIALNWWTRRNRLGGALIRPHEDAQLTLVLPGEAYHFFTVVMDWGDRDFKDLFLDALWGTIDALGSASPEEAHVKEIIAEARKKLTGELGLYYRVPQRRES